MERKGKDSSTRPHLGHFWFVHLDLQQRPFAIRFLFDFLACASRNQVANLAVVSDLKIDTRVWILWKIIYCIRKRLLF